LEGGQGGSGGRSCMGRMTFLCNCCHCGRLSYTSRHCSNGHAETEVDRTGMRKAICRLAGMTAVMEYPSPLLGVTAPLRLGTPHLCCASVQCSPQDHQDGFCCHPSHLLLHGGTRRGTYLAPWQLNNISAQTLQELVNGTVRKCHLNPFSYATSDSN
jgi:hypothetical protein